jgi:lysophospholipase L1-like esterase
MTPSRAASSSPLWAKLLLALLAPMVFIGLAELTIRITGIDYDLTRNENFDGEVPAWLLADDNFAAGVEPDGEAAKIAWLRDFTEARYIWTKLKPDIDVDSVNSFNDIELARGVTYHFSSNSDGFRSREFGPKDPGVIRIVCIGDSSTFGWGVDDEYTYPRLLETQLSRPGGPGVEVFNLGIPGFTTRHGLGVLRHYAVELEADFFVLSFGTNDPRWVLRSVDDVLSEDEGWLATLRFTALRFRSFLLMRPIAFALFDPTDQYAERGALVPSVSDAQYIENLQTMISIARDEGARPILMAECSMDTKVDQMREVAVATQVPMVDAAGIFLNALKT